MRPLSTPALTIHPYSPNRSSAAKLTGIVHHAEKPRQQQGTRYSNGRLASAGCWSCRWWPPSPCCSSSRSVSSLLPLSTGGLRSCGRRMVVRGFPLTSPLPSSPSTTHYYVFMHLPCPPVRLPRPSSSMSIGAAAAGEGGGWSVGSSLRACMALLESTSDHIRGLTG